MQTSQPATHPPKRYDKRAQVVRLWPEILARKRRGETGSCIYDDLVARGEVTMAMRTFMRWVARFSREQPYDTAPAAAPAEARAGSTSGSSGRIGRTSIQTMDDLKPKDFRPKARRS